MGKGQSLQSRVLGKLDRYIQKNQTGLLFHAMNRNELKWIEDLNVRP